MVKNEVKNGGIESGNGAKNGKISQENERNSDFSNSPPRKSSTKIKVEKWFQIERGNKAIWFGGRFCLIGFVFQAFTQKFDGLFGGFPKIIYICSHQFDFSEFKL